MCVCVCFLLLLLLLLYKSVGKIVSDYFCYLISVLFFFIKSRMHVFCSNYLHHLLVSLSTIRLYQQCSGLFFRSSNICISLVKFYLLHCGTFMLFLCLSDSWPFLYTYLKSSGIYLSSCYIWFAFFFNFIFVTYICEKYS